jgi:conserved oligomeric Golgi complex subunit 4
MATMASSSTTRSQSPLALTTAFQPGLVRTLTTTSQLHAHLASLTARESELTAALNDLVSNRDTLDSAVSRLQSLIPRIQEITIEVDGRPAHPGMRAPFGAWSEGNPQTDMEMEQPIGEEGLVDRVSRVWETSERVGGKVRKLDTEVSRVRDAAERVTAVLELKVSVMGGRARWHGVATHS